MDNICNATALHNRVGFVGSNKMKMLDLLPISHRNKTLYQEIQRLKSEIMDKDKKIDGLEKCLKIYIDFVTKKKELSDFKIIKEVNK